MTKRLDYLDMAKGVGIFLVVLGHIEYIQESTLKWIFSFHMPLFFVVGGVLAYLGRERRESVPQGLKRRAKGTLIPYASFSVALLTMSVIDFILTPEKLSGEALAIQFADALTGYGIHILWFLPAYFLANALFYLLGRTGKLWLRNLTVFLLAGLALSVSRLWGLEQYPVMALPFGAHIGMSLLITLLRAFLALPFLLTGWYFAAWEPGFSKGVRAGLSLLLLPAGYLALQTPVFDLHYLHVKAIHYLTAALACTGLLCLMKSLPVNRVLSYLGRNSLIIMCTHAAFFVVYYVSLGMFFVKKFIPMPQPVFNLGTAVLVCAAEIPVIWFFNRYLKQLLGRD